VSFDTLDITGTLDLSSATDTLTIDWLGDYAPELGDSFAFLTADTITGEFDIFNWAFGLPEGWRLTLDYQLDTSGRDVLMAQVSSVPVPGALWLFLSGLLGMVGLGRRKKVSSSV
jgi:hypothetical protein